MAYYITVTNDNGGRSGTTRVNSWADVTDVLDGLAAKDRFVGKTPVEIQKTMAVLREADLNDAYQDNELVLWDFDGQPTKSIIQIEGSPHTS